MQKSSRILLVSTFILGSISIIAILFLTNKIVFPLNSEQILLWSGFLIFFLMMINEGLMWIKNGKRGEWTDLVIIGFLFFTFFLLTNDVFNSFIGAFSIYLLIGIAELKDYEVLNKILYISVITYNVIFFVGLLDTYLGKDGQWRDTAFSLSFWLMLFLGFMFFGRRYMVVFRFMSPQYLTLGLYLIAWLAISTIGELTGISLIQYIYFTLILTNIIIYIFTGPLIDWMMGYKPIDDPKLTKIVSEIAVKMRLNPNKIKIRFGEYPILNAMAYGAVWDMHMAIIAPNLNAIPEDEIKGIIAHEMAHLRGKHTLSLTFITVGELVFRWLVGWPATYYDYTFNPDQPYPMWAFIVINFVIYIFLYIFVRIFEGRADLATRRAGLGYELAKGLYNLESFYAYGREIGLNTMLLCDEKITENNRTLDYLVTAQYLNRMIIKPSKGALISNFLNSHPPSYHRIIISLNDEEIGATTEAIMPITFLKKQNASEFFRNTQSGQQKFRKMVDSKIKEEFGIAHINEFYHDIEYLATFQKHKGKTYVFRNRLDNSLSIGKIIDISLVDNVCSPIEFEVQPMNQKTLSLEPIQENLKYSESLYELVEFQIGKTYWLRKEKQLARLTKLDLDVHYIKKHNQSKFDSLSEYKKTDLKGIFMFQSLTDGNKILEPIFKFKLPHPIEEISKYENKLVFIKEQGTSLPYLLNLISTSSKSTSEFSESANETTSNEDPVNQPVLPLIMKLSPQFNKAEYNSLFSKKESKYDSENSDIEISTDDYLVKFGSPYVYLHNDSSTKQMEQCVFSIAQERQTRISLLLKKAVNNEEDGIITQIDFSDNEDDESTIKIKNIFGEEKTLERKKIDSIYFEDPTLILQKKSNISGFTNIMNKLTERFSPQKIFVPNR